MRRMFIVVLLGLTAFGSGWYVPEGKGGNKSRHVTVSARAQGSCVCYCKSTKFGPGGVACMGGWLMVCRDRDGDGRNCGWDNVKDEKNNDKRCNGEC